MPRRSDRTPDEGPQIKGGVVSRQGEDDRPRRNKGAPIMGPRRARPGSAPGGTTTPGAFSPSGDLPESTFSGGISIPIFAVASYGERLPVDLDPDAEEKKGTPIPPHAPDDPNVLRRLFGV